MTVVFVTGVYDLLHVGHVRYLQRAKEQGDVLVVCVATDDCKKWRSGREDPVIPFEQRCELVAALRCVDIVIPYRGPGTYDAVEKHGASIRVITEQFPYDWPRYLEDYEELERRGVKHVIVPYTLGVSSTQIKEVARGREENTCCIGVGTAGVRASITGAG